MPTEILSFLINIIDLPNAELYSEHYQTSKMERFAQIINGFQLLTIFSKRSMLGVWQGFEYTSWHLISFL